MDATQKQEPTETLHKSSNQQKHYTCLLYTSDAADES